MSEREVIKVLITMLDEVIDYAGCMSTATNYNPKGSPNLLNMTRIVNEFKKEYIED